MQNLIKISQQTSWQILGKVVTSVSTFIILAIVARNYQESGTGTFTLALTYLTMFFLIADFGFNAHVLRKARIKWQKLLGTRLLWSLVLVILAIVPLPFLPFATASFSTAVLFGSIAILGSGIFITCNLIFQQKLRYDLSVAASGIGTLVYLFLVLLLSQNKMPLQYLVGSFAAGWIIIATLSLLLVNRFIRGLLPIFDFNFIKSLVKESWPIAATLALNVIYFRADVFILATFKTSVEVGIYNVSYSIFQSTLVLPTFIMNAYYPMMLKSFKGIRLIGLTLFLLASLGTVLTLMLSPVITRLLTGGGFLGSAQSLQILSLGYPAYFLSALLMWVLIRRGKYKTLLVIYTFGFIINLILNLTFIPQYSFYAASTTTVISEYLILVLLIVSLRV